MTMSKSCENCIAEGICLRRNEKISEGMMRACSRSHTMAQRWDTRFNVVDPSVVPLCFTKTEEETKETGAKPKPTKDRRKSQGRNKKVQERKLLGDQIQTALSLVGITEDKVTKWLGKPCGCGKRRKKMNDLQKTVEEALSGGVETAKKKFHNLLNSP